MATRRFISQLDRLSECQRENEAKADDLKAYAAQASRGRVLDASNAAVVSLRRAREAAVIEYESEMERRSVKKAADDQERARRESEEATLAAELGRARADADAKRREVTAILATDPGLRDLQEKLKLAYVIRARKEQLMEKEVLATREADVVKIADIEMEVRRQDALQQEKLKREALRQQYLAGRKQLEVQLTEKQKRDAASAAAESAAERALVAQIVLRIQQEDVADASARSAAREATRGIIEKYRAHHEHEKAAARAAEIEEGRNMRAWLEAQDVRNAEMQRSRAADAAAKEVAYAAVVAENGATRKKAEEEDQLRWLLVEEETERRRVEEEKARAVAVESSRREMMAANEQQRRLREELAARESAKEAAMIEQFLAKCVEDDRKDAMAKNARLEARTRYMAEVQAQASERHRAAETARMAELQALDEARAQDEFRKRVVQEARRQMLREHAAVLRGNLPRGVLMSQADVDFIKCFDGDKDGSLTAQELQLAQAAFNASC